MISYSRILLALLALGVSGHEEPKSSWLRHCEKDTPYPIEGAVEGVVPPWLEGRLTRVGPGMRYVGDTSYKHVFDALALLHLVTIQEGHVTYTSRFLESDAYKTNTAAHRIVVGGWWSPPYPDPCRSLLEKLASQFSPPRVATDNCLVNVLQTTDQMIAMTESDEVRVIDPERLDTLGDKIKISKYMKVRQATAHPHVGPNGTVYNLASTTTRKGPAYSIISLPNGRIEDGKVEVTIPARWKFHPSYMHSFAITEHYYVLIEAPFTISIGGLLKTFFWTKNLDDAMVWFPNETVHFRVIDRYTGQEHQTKFVADAFFVFHHINAYETKDDMLVIDVCTINTGEIIKTLYYENLEKADYDATKKKYNSVAKRFVLPIGNVGKMPMKKELLEGIQEAKMKRKTASAKKIDKETIFLQGLTINNDFFEMPRINYAYNGKPYRYAYGVGTAGKSLDLTSLIKIDLKSGKKKVWTDPEHVVSEPIFVPSPEQDKKSGLEDDGVVLSLLIHKNKPRLITLLVLDAKSFTQTAKVEFETRGTAMPSFHGQFVRSIDKVHGY